MAKIAQLVEGNYNILDNIPVINQDLSASGFTPVANTYYRHTGATTDTFTQGVIYLYDTAYHKLGESGGGTTLNQYTYFVDITNLRVSELERLLKILTNAKGNIIIGSPLNSYTIYTPNYACYRDNFYALTLCNNEIDVSGRKTYQYVYNVNTSETTNKTKTLTRTLYMYTLTPGGTISFTDKTSESYANSIGVMYYNDTEIT